MHTSALVAAYVSAGFFVWHRFVANPAGGHNDPLARCERFGGASYPEAAAFVVVKTLFIVSWVACLAFYTIAQAVIRLR